MNEPLKVMHDGIEIRYVEGEDVWRFELRGRERSSESLAKAKEAIDKPEPKERKPFTRFKAYRSSYGERYVVVEVTSFADTPFWSGTQYWVTGDKKREKVSHRNLYPVNEHNTPLVEQIAELSKQVDELQDKIRKVSEKLQSVAADKE
jgi:pyocin large subunit-like protein